MFLTNIQKDSLNLHYKKQCETEVKNFLTDFSILTTCYMPMLIATEIPWSRILGNLNFIMDKIDRDDGK